MHLAGPTLDVDGGHLHLRAACAAANDLPTPVVSLSVPTAGAGAVDPTLTPLLPLAVLTAALVGEDLDVDGPACPATAAAAREAVSVLAGFWGWQVPEVRLHQPAPRVPVAERGHGLFFTRGIDSWWALSHLLDGPVAGVPTHLLFVSGAEPRWDRARQAAEEAAVARTAERLGLPLVVVATDARRLLDPLAVWDRTHGAVLASVAHLLAPLLERVTVSSSWGFDPPPPWGSHPEVDPRWTDGTVTVDHLGATTTRADKVARLLERRPEALADLKVCWEGDTPRNCGRCAKCVRTMVLLVAAGAEDLIGEAFDHPLDPATVRRLPPPNDLGQTELALADLPPEQVALRAAVRSIVDPARRRPAWFVSDSGRAPLGGPGPAARLAAAVHEVGAQVLDGADPTQPAPDPGDPATRVVEVGWLPGQLPLRPRHDARHQVRVALAGRAARPHRWTVVEHHDPRATHDPGQARLVAELQRRLGPAPCYLPGLPWADDPTAAGLSPAAVARLLGGARTRLWWRDGGGLDPLRLVESLEAGCRPVQVMPGPVARALRSVLPAGLGPAVVGDDEVEALAATLADPTADAAAVAAVAAVALAGSVERDVVGAER